MIDAETLYIFHSILIGNINCYNKRVKMKVKVQCFLQFCGVDPFFSPLIVMGSDILHCDLQLGVGGS